MPSYLSLPSFVVHHYKTDKIKKNSAIKGIFQMVEAWRLYIAKTVFTCNFNIMLWVLEWHKCIQKTLKCCVHGALFQFMTVTLVNL